MKWEAKSSAQSETEEEDVGGLKKEETMGVFQVTRRVSGLRNY